MVQLRDNSHYFFTQPTSLQGIRIASFHLLARQHSHKQLAEQNMLNNLKEIMIYRIKKISKGSYFIAVIVKVRITFIFHLHCSMNRLSEINWKLIDREIN